MQWAVVATVAEPVQLVCAFAAHHLQLGAARVHLFLDRPDREVQACLGPVPGVELTVCDEAYWQARGGRPGLVTERQKRNAQSVYERGAYEWLLHIDADEFVRDSEGLRQAMAGAGPEIAQLRLRVSERVRLANDPNTDIFAGAFRIPGDRPADFYRSIYGEHAAQFLHKGLKAYCHFKSLYRRGRGLRIGIHAARNAREVAGEAAFVPGRPLLHFDGLTAHSWIEKMYRKLQIEDYRNKPNPARRAQLIRFETLAEDPRAIADLFERLDRIDGPQAARLDREGLLVREAFSPRPALEALFGANRFDLSAAAFDARVAMAPEIRALGEG